MAWVQPFIHSTNIYCAPVPLWHWSESWGRNSLPALWSLQCSENHVSANRTMKPYNRNCLSYVLKIRDTWWWRGCRGKSDLFMRDKDVLRKWSLNGDLIKMGFEPGSRWEKSIPERWSSKYKESEVWGSMRVPGIATRPVWHWPKVNKSGWVWRGGA